jgi:hypothetical protein
LPGHEILFFYRGYGHDHDHGLSFSDHIPAAHVINAL